MRRHLLAAAGLVTTVLAALTGTAGPAAAATYSNLVWIASYDTGQCADVYLGNTASGAHVVSEPCANYSEQYWWVNLTAPSVAAFTFTNYLTGKCLAATGGGGVVATTCNSSPYQQWTYNGTPTRILPVPGPYRYNFVNRGNGKYLQSAGANGTQLRTGTRDYGYDQRWVLGN